MVYKVYCFKGDMLWGRKGKYTTSYFVLEAVLINNVVGKDFKTALTKIRNILIQPHLDSDILLDIYAKELCLDIDEYMNLSYLSDRIQETVLSEVALRYLDIEVHRPNAFVKGENVDVHTLKKQLEAVQFLTIIDKNLSHSTDRVWK